jgi:hypothetical protein
MKKVFIQVVPLQPFVDEADPSKGTKLQKGIYDTSTLGPEFEYGETSFPLIPLINGNVSPGDIVEIIILKPSPTRPNIMLNLEQFKAELKSVLTAKNVIHSAKVEIMDIPNRDSEHGTLLLFNELRKRILPDTMLSCDFTFGTNTIQLMLYNLMRYANQAIDDFEIGWLIYGQRDWNTGEMQIIDESFNFTIDSVITASLVGDGERLDNALYAMTGGESLNIEVAAL